MTEITKLHYFDEHKLKGSTTFHLSFNLHVPDDTEQIVVGIVRWEVDEDGSSSSV